MSSSSPMCTSGMDDRLQGDAHFFDGAEDAVFRRFTFEPKRRGHFANRSALDMPQHERGTLHFCEPSKRLPNPLVDLGAEGQPVGAQTCRYRLVSRRILQVGAVMSDLARSPRPNEIYGAVHGDSVEPGSEIRACLEAAQLTIGLEKCLLHNVLCVLAAAGEPIGDMKHVLRVTLDERLECVCVAIAHPGDGGAVALVHP